MTFDDYDQCPKCKADNADEPDWEAYNFAVKAEGGFKEVGQFFIRYFGECSECGHVEHFTLGGLTAPVSQLREISRAALQKESM